MLLQDCAPRLLAFARLPADGPRASKLEVETLNRTGLVSTRFDAALAYALDAHDQQFRKGTRVPYAAHLLSVAGLVLEDGGSEEEAMEALFHDVVEDQGGLPRLADVRERFGDRIADVVAECSGDDKSTGLPWAERKQRYLNHVVTSSDAALRVSLADKLHNARSILTDYREQGDQLWSRFNAPEPKGENTLWLYESLVAAYQQRLDGRSSRLLDELSLTVRELRTLVDAAGVNRGF